MFFCCCCACFTVTTQCFRWGVGFHFWSTISLRRSLPQLALYSTRETSLGGGHVLLGQLRSNRVSMFNNYQILWTDSIHFNTNANTNRHITGIIASIITIDIDVVLIVVILIRILIDVPWERSQLQFVGIIRQKGQKNWNIF